MQSQSGDYFIRVFSYHIIYKIQGNAEPKVVQKFPHLCSKFSFKMLSIIENFVPPAMQYYDKNIKFVCAATMFQ